MLLLAFFQNLGATELILISIAALLLYALPAFIAFRRGHQNAAAILALNLLSGWTFLGWIAALVWSLTAVEKR